MELTKKEKKQTTIKYKKMDECYICIEKKWKKGVMIHRKLRENVFTILELKTNIDFLFLEVILSLIDDYYLEGYQIAIHVNGLATSPLWINDDDENIALPSPHIELANELTNNSTLTGENTDGVMCYCNMRARLITIFHGAHRKFYICYGYPNPNQCKFFLLKRE